MALTSPSAGPEDRTDQPRLGCGRPIDDVWLTIESPPTAHERSCPDCQAARLSLVRLEESAMALRSADDLDPEMQPSTRAKDSIMELARAEVRRGQMLPLNRPSPSQPTELTISEQSVAAVVRRTADDVPGVLARRCLVRLAEDDLHPRPDGSDAVPAEPGASRIRIELSTVVAVGRPAGRLSDDLRRQIRAAVQRQTGMDVVAVDITVEDLFDA